MYETKRSIKPLKLEKDIKIIFFRIIRNTIFSSNLLRNAWREWRSPVGIIWLSGLRDRGVARGQSMGADFLFCFDFFREKIKEKSGDEHKIWSGHQNETLKNAFSERGRKDEKRRN